MNMFEVIAVLNNGARLRGVINARSGAHAASIVRNADTLGEVQRVIVYTV